MQTQGCTCLPSGTSPHADADAGSFREFRMERSGILEAMTLVSPVGMGRSMMQAHRSDWVKVSLSLAPNLNPIAAMYYGFSVFHCMTQSLAQGGPGLGTCMGPARLEELIREAGFTRFETLELKSLMSLFYAVRK